MAKKTTEEHPGDMAFDEFVKRPPELTILPDEPLTAEQLKKLFKSDPFNLCYKLGPVYDILRYGIKGGDSNQMPTAILITGDWGTGKTTAMKWLEVLLEEWNKKPTDIPEQDYIKVHPVWFYPWKYHDKEAVWKGLLSEVIINAVYVRNPENKKVTINSKKLLTGLKLLGSFGLNVISDLAAASEYDIPLIQGLKISGEALKKVKEHYSQAAHPEAAFLNELEEAMKHWVRESLGKNQRMVIFIDDLDRCMPEIALQVLEALKLYLNIPNLIFVLGVDKKVVEKLVIEHYKKLGLVKEKDKDREETQTEREDRLQAERKARQYLSKMFQTEIELAPSEKQIDNFFVQHIQDIAQSDPRLKKSEHQELFKRLILKFARRNPREVKRQLNNALIAGAGTRMIDVEGGERQQIFEQGLQLYFIREVLKGYTIIAEMINTDLGMRFFSDWSELVVRDGDKSSGLLIEPLELSRDGKPSISDEMIAKDAEYKKKNYIELLSNQDLQDLIQIPFSKRLAELVAEISAATASGHGKVVSLEGIAEVTVEGLGKIGTERSRDHIVIRDAVARQRNTKPEELSGDDYLKITELDLGGSGISDISILRFFTNLQTLNLFGTQVSDLGALSGLTNLQKLFLVDTQVSDLGALSGLTNLQELNLRNTQVSDLGALSGLTKLYKLILSDTQISDLGALSGLTKLYKLSLSNTQVSDLGALSGLTNLQELNLDDTQVSDLGVLSGLTNLQTLYLFGTQVSDEQVAELHKALPKLKVKP